MKDQVLGMYKEEVSQELHMLLDWWSTYAVDQEYGGFWGTVREDNCPEKNAAKGLVLNARILWTFSSAHMLTGNSAYLTMASRAFDYLAAHFWDDENAGFYWSVDDQGNMLDGKKQIYGQAFAIYGLAEYYKATDDEQALTLAKKTFHLIEKFSYDREYLGYVDAFTQTWQSGEDLRLSEKDLNEKKLMNTHLHVIEAYANLYAVWKDETLKERIKELLWVFDKHIIDSDIYHLKLYFTEDWKSRSGILSFGHDIEAAWLLLEAAEQIGDAEEISRYKGLAVKISQAVLKGLGEDGGLYYEYDADTAHWNREKHWWPQAEAMVGFYNAYQLNDDPKYLEYSLNTWSFIKQYIIDHEGGEWHWGIDTNGHLMQEGKASFWKCPYHNARACMEIMKRIKV